MFGYNMYEIKASVAQLVEQSAFNRLVAGSSPAGGIMKNVWMRINHVDGTQKVFFQLNGVPRHFDMSSPELSEAVKSIIDSYQDDIRAWEDLLEKQKEWIDAKKSY